MIVENLHGTTEYLSLPKQPLYDATQTGFSEDYGTGVKLVRVWFGPRTGRAFIETDSRWENRQTHSCVGRTTREIELEELLRICQRFGLAVPPQIQPAVID